MKDRKIIVCGVGRRGKSYQFEGNRTEVIKMAVEKLDISIEKIEAALDAYFGIPEIARLDTREAAKTLTILMRDDLMYKESDFPKDPHPKKDRNRERFNRKSKW